MLLGIFLSLRKTSAKVDSLTTEVRTRALPAVEAAQSLITTSAPKLEEIVSNVHTTTLLVRGQVEPLDNTVSDIIDRTRLQVIRADDMISRAMDRVEETTELVQHSVISPVRHIAGIISGLTVGLQTLLRRKGQHPQEGAPQDEELFI